MSYGMNFPFFFGLWVGVCRVIRRETLILWGVPHKFTRYKNPAIRNWRNFYVFTSFTLCFIHDQMLLYRVKNNIKTDKMKAEKEEKKNNKVAISNWCHKNQKFTRNSPSQNFRSFHRWKTQETTKKTLTTVSGE